MIVEYKDVDVLTAARARLAFVFDRFSRVVVSVSAGKDSTVLRHLACAEAARRGRRITLFFLDQEAEYQSTIDLIKQWMSDASIDPQWYQVPIRMTNATSHLEYFLYAWEPGARWVRDKHPLAIHEIAESYPQRFYPFFDWYEQRAPTPTAFLVGLRSKESLNRFRAVTRAGGYEDVSWSTATKTPGTFRFYPIYDWTFGDIWKYIADNELRYNAHYDRMFAKHGDNISKMRVSNLIHEKAFRSLADLQEFEPDTYERLLGRLRGVHAAALYATDQHVFNARTLPAGFTSWGAYRDYLVASTPLDRRGRFVSRFAKQADDEETHRMQCQQVLCNDWENSLPVKKDRRAELRARWWDRL